MIEGMLTRIGKSTTIDRKTITEGDCSGDTTFWTTLATVTAAIATISGSEAIRADKLGVKASHIMYINVISGLTENDRVKQGSIYYKVKFVDNPMMCDKFYQVYIERDDNYGSSSQ